MIQADVSADEELRATAIKIASGEGDCYHWTNSFVWGAIQDASRPQQEADRAVTIAEVICARFPNNGGFLNTLGIAYYRAGRYGEALRTLHRSDELNRKDTGRSHPIDLAAIITTLVKLDRRPEAEAMYRQLQTLMADPANASDRDNLRFTTEARTLLEQ